MPPSTSCALVRALTLGAWQRPEVAGDDGGAAAQVAGFLEARLLLSEEHALQFSHADLLVIDRTNPMDNGNEEALVDHAIGHTDGRDGSTLRVKFFLNTDALAGKAAAVARMQRMQKSLMQPMGRWCAPPAHTPCFAQPAYTCVHPE